MLVVREAVTHMCRWFEPRVLQLQGQTPPLFDVTSENGLHCACVFVWVFLGQRTSAIPFEREYIQTD